MSTGEPERRIGARGGRDLVLSFIAVVAALAVIAVVGLRALERNRQRAIRTVCQTNMHCIGISIITYFNDYNGMLPSSFLYGRSKTWNRTDFINFAKLRGVLPAPPNSTVNTWPMLVYGRHPQSVDVFWCPSDPAGRTHAGPSDPVSYYWKAAVDAAWYAGHGKEGDFEFPSDQIILYEHNAWHTGEVGRGLTDGVAINVYYLDGHAQQVTIRDSGYTISENPPEPLPKSGVGEPAWYNYSYGAKPPRFSKGSNWDPHVWGDKLP